MTLWKDSKRGSAQELIDWLLGQTTGTGWPMYSENMIAFAELAASSIHPDLSTNMVMQVLTEMSRTQKKTTEEFESIYQQKLRDKISAQRNSSSLWSFFIPVEIKLGLDILRTPSLQILDKRFSFITRKSVERQVDKVTRKVLAEPDLIWEHTSVRVRRVPDLFLSVRGYGANWDMAWRAVSPAFDALRGIIELTLNLGGWRFSFGDGGKNPRRTIPHPSWLLAYKKGEKPEWAHFVIESVNDKPTYELSNETLKIIQINARFLRKEPAPKRTLSLIADCMRLYSQAMDAHFKHLCFLGFWQLAEAITNSETVGGDTRKVVARLAWHGSRQELRGSGYSETLMTFGRKRNDIVHRGIHEVEDDDINILKLACEVALMWLIGVHKSLPTVTHLERFYQLREISDPELKAIEECVTYVQKIYRKSEPKS